MISRPSKERESHDAQREKYWQWEARAQTLLEQIRGPRKNLQKALFELLLAGVHNGYDVDTYCSRLRQEMVPGMPNFWLLSVADDTSRRCNALIANEPATYPRHPVGTYEMSPSSRYTVQHEEDREREREEAKRKKRA